MINFKTTIIGIIGAIVVAVLPLLQGATLDWKNIATAAVLAGLGWFSKDHDVSGGARQQ